MRTRRTLAALGSLISLGASAWAGGIYYRVAILTGDQETPPNASTALGVGTFEINTCLHTMRYRITTSCLSAAETAAHIHGFSAPGVASGVVHPLPAGNVKVGVWNYPPGDERAILDGRTYVNIHTAAFGGGEIRGQIVSHVALLDGGQETPPNGSPARGFALFNFDTVNDRANYYISYAGLTGVETAAHIHGFSRHGVASGVIFPLPAGNPKVGVWNYNPADEPIILDGMTYVNIHTTAFPGGEIRGNVTSIVNNIDGGQETPPVASVGAGVGLFSINSATDELGYDIRHCGIPTAETAAHIHGFAPAGTPAGVLFNLGVGVRKAGAWAFGAANEANLRNELTYVNIHSVANGGGEIRGQVRFTKPLCVADLDCNSAVDIGDLSQLLSNFGSSTPLLCDGDINNDGMVDIVDLSLLLSNFGVICP